MASVIDHKISSVNLKCVRFSLGRRVGGGRGEGVRCWRPYASRNKDLSFSPFTLPSCYLVTKTKSGVKNILIEFRSSMKLIKFFFVCCQVENWFDFCWCCCYSFACRLQWRLNSVRVCCSRWIEHSIWRSQSVASLRRRAHSASFLF